MVLVGQAVRVGEMGVGAAELLRLVVHQLHKGVDAAGDMDGHRVGRVVSRGDQQIGKQIGKADLLAGDEIDRAALLIELVGRLLGDGDGVARVAVLEGQRRGQQLGGAGGIKLFIGVLLQKGFAAGLFIENGRLGSDLGRGQRKTRQGQQSGSQQRTENFFQHFQPSGCFFVFFMVLFYQIDRRISRRELHVCEI